MPQSFQEQMHEATRLTQAGRLLDATRLIQRALAPVSPLRTADANTSPDVLDGLVREVDDADAVDAVDAVDALVAPDVPVLLGAGAIGSWEDMVQPVKPARLATTAMTPAASASLKPVAGACKSQP